MRAPREPRPLRRLEAWLWTGPLGHLLGGTLDVLQALARHLLMPRLRQLSRRPPQPPPHAPPHQPRATR